MNSAFVYLKISKPSAASLVRLKESEEDAEPGVYKLNSRWGDVTYEQDMHVFTIPVFWGLVNNPGKIGRICHYNINYILDPSRFVFFNLWFLFGNPSQIIIGVLAPAVPQLPESARSAKRWDYTGGYRPAERKPWAGPPLRSTSTFKHLHWYAFLMDGIRWIIRVYFA